MGFSVTQYWAASAPLSWSCNLSAMRAMNSLLVGLPLVLDTVYPKKRCRVSRYPRSQATSMAWRMARSTLLGVVWNVFATWGYNTLVMAFVSLTGHGGASGQDLLWDALLLSQLPTSLLVRWACHNDNKIQLFRQVSMQQTSEKRFLRTKHNILRWKTSISK